MPFFLVRTTPPFANELVCRMRAENAETNREGWQRPAPGAGATKLCSQSEEMLPNSHLVGGEDAKGTHLSVGVHARRSP